MTRKAAATDTRRTLAELEAAVLAGDTSITAEDLARARAQQDHERLLSEAAEHRAHREAEAVRQADVERLRADIAALADDRDLVLRLAGEATEALSALFHAARSRAGELDRLAARARSLGITAMTIADEVRDPSGIGWRSDWQTYGPARIRLGDVALGAVDPMKVTARVVRDVLVAAGQRHDAFSLAHTSESVADQVSATVREVQPPELVRLRVLKRWGPHQPGALIEKDLESAQWAITRGYAAAA